MTVLARATLVAVILTVGGTETLDAQDLRFSATAGWLVPLAGREDGHLLGAQARLLRGNRWEFRVDGMWAADRVFVLPALSWRGPMLGRFRTYVFGGPGAEVQFERVRAAAHGGLGVDLAAGNTTLFAEFGVLHLRVGDGLTRFPLRMGATVLTR